MSALKTRTTHADVAAVLAWLTDLTTDMTDGKVVGFQLVVKRDDNGAYLIDGKLETPPPSGLKVKIKDDKKPLVPEPEE